MNLAENVGIFFTEAGRFKRYGLIFVCGMLASLSLPPANIWPVLLGSVPGLIFAMDSLARQRIGYFEKFRKAFWLGWWFGFGFFLVSLYWIGAAFLVEADKFAALIPFAVCVLPAGLAIFWGLAASAAVRFWYGGFGRVVVLAIFLTVAEWLRGHILSGLPWNTIGYAGLDMGYVGQLASITGLYGLTLLVLIWAGVPVLLTGRKPAILTAGLIVASFAGGQVIGYVHRTSEKLNSSGQPIIRIVQPNIDQKEKWDRNFIVRNIDRYLKLSTSGAGLGKVDILVWPESALPVLYDQSSQLKAKISGLLGDKTKLIMGGVRRSQGEFYNSTLVVGAGGQVLMVSDKSHLVPFGEYLPGEALLKPLGIRKLVAFPSGFKAGQGPVTIKLDNLPSFTSLICYEIIFPSEIIDRKNRPQFIVNVTNDGWFGKTAGPHQHLAQARMRAIEQGLAIIRAANTGISAMIDPFGNIVRPLGLGEQGIIDVQLVKPIKPTIYSRWGDGIAGLMIVCMLMILLIVQIYKKSLINRRKHQ